MDIYQIAADVLLTGAQTGRIAQIVSYLTALDDFEFYNALMDFIPEVRERTKNTKISATQYLLDINGVSGGSISKRYTWIRNRYCWGVRHHIFRKNGKIVVAKAHSAEKYQCLSCVNRLGKGLKISCINLEWGDLDKAKLLAGKELQ